MNSTDTIIDHRRRIRRVTNYINQHLDARVTLNRLADIACYSNYHFIRVFEMLMGETPNQYIIRKKMEKAGSHLLQGNLSVTDVALGLAYGTPSSFCKKFKNHYGMSPRQFRDSVPIDHYRLSNHPFRPITGNRNPSDSIPTPAIKKLPELNFLYIKNHGVINGTFLTTALPSFDRFKKKIHQNELQDITFNSASIYPFRPLSFDDDQAVNLVGAVVKQTSRATEGLNSFTIPEGKYAIFNHYGSYDYIAQTWNQICMNWYPKSGKALRDAPPLEIHLGTDDSESSLELVAHVMIPIH